MPHNSIIYFDVAAVVVMSISLASLILRDLTKGAANRVYITAMILVTATTVMALIGEIYDAFIGPALVAAGPTGSELPRIARSGVAMIYYALRSLTAPVYLILIATVSDTTHRLDMNTFVRIALWGPMIAVLALIFTNPLHHLVFSFEDGMLQRKILLQIIYAEAAYYSMVGIAWLARWRLLFSNNELATLVLLYPIMLAATIVQYYVPEMRIELFVTSIAMMLMSAFVIHPETRQNLVMNAASLQSYNEMCSRAFVTGKQLCLVYIEVVNLNQLRELVGKIELQEIMRGMSARLSATLERDDILYYLHDGVFCISPRNIDPDHALAIARETHEAGKARAALDAGSKAPAKMRSCVVRIPQDVSNAQDLRNFGKRFAHLVPDSDVTTYEELSKRDDFRMQTALSDIIARAIESRSFEIHYQPIYCLESGTFRSAEALVRLKDPEFGWVPPSLFIPESEQSGAIADIGSILLEKICAFLGGVDFEQTGLEYLEVNLSVEQCVRPELADELIDLANRYDVEPHRLNLEITETSSVYSQEAIEGNARMLAAAGFTLSLDDYGTGYSSIARTMSLPFSLVKIDKSFVDRLDDGHMRTVLADTVATMHRIDKRVLVEGVETGEQAAMLEAMGADYIQGYYYARPLPEDEFTKFLVEHNSLHTT